MSVDGGVMITQVPQREEDDEDDDPWAKTPGVEFDRDVSYAERSAHLYSDAKYRELKNYLGSHKHEERLRAAAELGSRQDSPKASSSSYAKPRAKPSVKEQGKTLRAEGCLAVDRHMRKLLRSTPSLPPIGPACADVPLHLQERNEYTLTVQDELRNMNTRQAALQRKDGFQSRLQWRKAMDVQLRRLLTDLDLSRDDRLKEYADQSRCEHLDKVFEWKKTQGGKESRKEEPSPAFVYYRSDGPVLPGSMRVNWPYLQREASTCVCKNVFGIGEVVCPKCGLSRNEVAEMRAEMRRGSQGSGGASRSGSAPNLPTMGGSKPDAGPPADATLN